MFFRSLRPTWNGLRPNIDKGRKISYALWCIRFIMIRALVAPFEYALYRLFIKNNISLPESPIIILGHHRSGTTFLQGVLNSHPQHKSIRLFDTLFPDIMVLGNWTLRPILNLILKFVSIEMELHKKRMHMDFPGEEDVALLSLLNPMAYNWGHIYPDQIDEISKQSIVKLKPDSSDYKKWKSDYLMFLKKFIFLYSDKRLVLKSPPSVARPHLMMDLFPKAKFIFLMRDPYSLYPSMINFWKISGQFTFQNVDENKIDQLIFNQTNELIGNYRLYKDCIPSENLIEIRHEDLKNDPLSVLEMIHQKLDLGDFSAIEEHYKHFIAQDKGVGIRIKNGEFSANAENRAKVEKHWSSLLQFYQTLGK